MAKETVHVIEVGPRDGLQNEKRAWSPAERIELCLRLSQTGLKTLEVGAFVSPKWVPQMVGSETVLAETIKLRSQKKIPETTRISVLVPNLQGATDAMASSPDELAFFTAATEGFSKKNSNCTIDESLERFNMAITRFSKIPRRIYISTCFYCPYDGKTPPALVIDVVEKLLPMGFREFSIGDTIGAATPRDVKTLLEDLKSVLPLKSVAMHFHDTRGTAIANIYESLNMGIRSFDSSIGGLGGCPYAPGATGNVATEDVVYILESEGFSTGVKLEELFETNQWISGVIGQALPSRVGKARLPKGFS